MMQIIFAVIFVILACFSLLFKNYREKEFRVISKIGFSVFITISAVLFITSTFTVISSGHKGVVTLFGQVNKEVLDEGFHMVNPMASVIQMSCRVEKEEERHPAETSDTQSVSLSVITNWRPRGNALANLYQVYGIDYASKIIPPAVREAVKAEVAKYKVTELIARRPDIHDHVKQYINEWLNKYDLDVLEVAISDIDFSDKYDAAIEAKQVQEQQALQKQYELQRTETEAKMAQAEAEGKANAAIQAARGQAEAVKLKALAEAESMRIRGEAEAEYNRRVSESLTPILIQSHYSQKWDGRLPVYSLGSEVSPMLMLPDVIKQGNK